MKAAVTDEQLAELMALTKTDRRGQSLNETMISKVLLAALVGEIIRLKREAATS